MDRPEQTLTVRFFISSLAPADMPPERFASTIREHWNIENGTHWRRDVVWGEDKQRLKHHGSAHILSTLRQVALYLHTTSPLPHPSSIASALQHVHHHKQSGINIINRPP